MTLSITMKMRHNITPRVVILSVTIRPIMLYVVMLSVAIRLIMLRVVC
jgi:hypothetical protein